MTTTFDAVDLFAGPGGWDVAARDLGMHVIGLELDRWACETRRAAGLPTVEGDVRAYGPADFPAAGLIASPPCQTFSAAGKGAGREALDTVLALVKAAAARQDIDQLLAGLSDERTGLVLEPLRWALEAVDAGTPYRWLAFEQVPTVLPVWEAMADVLRAEGYSVAAANVQAEQYGVAQTRKRAVLVARRDGEARLPVPTHSRYHVRDKTRLDPGVLPWVSMAEALGWGMTARPSMTVTGGGTAAGGAEPFGNAARQGMAREAGSGAWSMRSNYGTQGDPRNRGVRAQDEPAPTVTSKINRNLWLYNGNQPHSAKRAADEPAPTLHFGGRANAVTWQESEDIDPRDTRVVVRTSMGEPKVDGRNGTHELDPFERPEHTITTKTGEWRVMMCSAGRTSPQTAGQVPRDGDPSITGKGTAAWVFVQSAMANATRRSLDEPAPTITAAHDRAERTWQQPGESVRVTVEEAAALQSFPPDHPWQGTKTARYQQVGNAIPPLLAKAVLAEVTGA